MRKMGALRWMRAATALAFIGVPAICMARRGHTATHFPHTTHVLGRGGGPSSTPCAACGQTFMHSPQFTHRLLVTVRSGRGFNPSGL